MFVKTVNYLKMLFCPTIWNIEFGSSHHHKNILKHLPWSWIWTFSKMMAVAQHLLSARPGLFVVDLDGRETPSVMFSWVLLTFGVTRNPSPLPCELTLMKTSVHLLSQPSGASRWCKGWAQLVQIKAVPRTRCVCSQWSTTARAEKWV